ncbi:RNA-guided endonuclease InsQ/TnpB family protein [Pyrinomonas methylaliphatogenes]|uniref:Transposase, IS605 OrfB family, central region n=1 Tax=Pyrinomonas methylaliphatogenes TaxID=454194 RepID=A0A0B6WYN6_9BACT|nr:RNA-guided endonuclease TnpB family protein [Pyrinomonas methylaliphatogenes]CDM65414.1 transposase, IS605 OrfB family, central region [Pyrinomonas methylaliphatogenes]
MPILTIKAQIHTDVETERILRDAMFCATKVYNGLMWHLRHQQEETGRIDVRRSNLNRILSTLPRARGYYSMSVQLTRDEVRQAWRSFFALRRNGRTDRSAPGFRPKSMLSPIKYVQSGFRVKGDRLTLSLGMGREDGVRSVTVRLSHRPGVEYERVREVSITYDTLTGRLEARLVVEVRARENHGTSRLTVDLGETVLLAAAFEDGTALLYSGRLIKAIRRYWQKVRSYVRPPSRERPHKSRRFLQIAHQERRQLEHLLHIVTSHFIRECVRRGVGEIAIGDLVGIRHGMDYGARMNQRLHAWPYRKIINMIRYKAALVGIAVRDDVNERGTSCTCHACGRTRRASRVHRGLYRCPCEWTAQADVNGALNIYQRAFHVSPVKGSSGRVARPVVLSFLPGWHTVHEPKRRPILRPST